MIGEGVKFFPFYFLHFIFESFHFFLFYFILFCFVSNSNKHFNVCSFEKILLLVVDVFWCSSSGDALAFAHFRSSSNGIVFLATLETMCHLSLGVWKKKTHCFFLFVFVVFINFINFCFVDFYFSLKFLHSTIERTLVRSILDTGLRSSPHTLARV